MADLCIVLYMKSVSKVNSMSEKFKFKEKKSKKHPLTSAPHPLKQFDHLQNLPKIWHFHVSCFLVRGEVDYMKIENQPASFHGSRHRHAR